MKCKARCRDRQGGSASKRKETALEWLLRLTERDERAARRFHMETAHNVSSKVYWRGVESGLATAADRIRRMIAKEGQP